MSEEKENKNCTTKADLVESIYLKLHIDKLKAKEIVEDSLELLKDGIKKDGKLMLSGFGTFVVHHKKPRKGRNPQTSEPLILRERKVVKFKPSQKLKDATNRETVES